MATKTTVKEKTDSTTKVSVYKADGTSSGEIQLHSEIFAVPQIKQEVVHQVATALLSSQRNTVAATKTRGEVRGGGRKPWRQKGTGRARAGSIRSPLWKGGGVTFGPRPNRNFKKHVNKQMKQASMRMAFTDRARAHKVFVVENITLAEAKTKEFQKFVDTLRAKIKGLSGKILFIISEKNDTVERAARNVKNSTVIDARNINLLDLLSHESVVVTKDALSIIDKRYSNRNT